MHARRQIVSAGTLALWLTGLAVLAISACSSDAASEPVCNCPVDLFGITVPAGRSSDIASITASGSCSDAQKSDDSHYVVEENSVGVCHIAVKFKGGSPEFDTDVMLERGTVGCEAVCFPTPTSTVIIPDVDGASGEGGEGGEGG